MPPGSPPGGGLAIFAPAGLAVRGRRVAGARGRRRSRRAAMDDPKRKILIADIDDRDVLVLGALGLLGLADFVDVFLHDEGRGGRRFAALRERGNRNQHGRNQQSFKCGVLHDAPPAMRQKRNTGPRRLQWPPARRCNAGPNRLALWRGRGDYTISFSTLSAAGRFNLSQIRTMPWKTSPVRTPGPP